MVSPQHGLASTGFPTLFLRKVVCPLSRTSWHLPPLQQAECWRHSEFQRGKRDMLTPAQHSSTAAASPEQNSTKPQQAIRFSYLGTPALEPMPEDCRECRRFLAVASGWASANCWMAACRALREAASLRGGMKWRGDHWG